MKNECDCKICFNDDKLISKSDIIDYIEEECYSANRYRKNIAWIKNKEKELKLLTPLDYLDKRKGFLTFFNFCPNCDKKINLKNIKEKLKLKKGLF